MRRGGKVTHRYAMQRLCTAWHRSEKLRNGVALLRYEQHSKGKASRRLAMRCKGIAWKDLAKLNSARANLGAVLCSKGVAVH